MKTTKVIAERRDYGTDPTAPPNHRTNKVNPPTSINQRTQPQTRPTANGPNHQPDQQPRVPPTGRLCCGDAQSAKCMHHVIESLSKFQIRMLNSHSICTLLLSCNVEPKKAPGAPRARNDQFAKENVIEKQHFGDRLQKLGFWGLQEPKKAQGAPGARNGQFAN